MTDLEVERKLTEEHLLLHRKTTKGVGIIPRSNCELCYPVKGSKTRANHIDRLFDFYRKIFPEALVYNRNTQEEYSRLRGNLSSRRSLRSLEKLNKLDLDSEERALNIVLTIRYKKAPKYPAEQISYALIRTIYNTAAFTNENPNKEFIAAINLYQQIISRPFTNTQKKIELISKLYIYYSLIEEDIEEAERSFHSPLILSPQTKEFPSSKSPSPIPTTF